MKSAMRLILGQGRPLPDGFPYRGEWVIENAAFIYHEDGSQILIGDSPRFTVVKWVDGKPCVGFDAAQVAACLKVDVSEIWAGNQTGAFAIKGTLDIAPQHGGKAARRYVFTLGDKEGALAVETPAPGGTS